MKLKWIEAEYFLVFGKKFKIVFPEEFNYAIVGRWKDQPRRSNWAGKSSFLEIIKFLKYGECRAKYLKDIPNDQHNKPAKVSGCIEFDDGQELIIHREVNGNSSSLFVEGFEAVDKRVLQAKLDELFGYSYDDYIKTSFFNQGQISQFLEATSSEKLIHLNKWLEIKSWNDCCDLTKKKLSVCETQIDKGKQKILQEDSFNEEVKKLIDSRNHLEGNLKQLGEMASNCSQTIIEFEKHVVKVADEIENLNNKYEDLNKRIARSKSIKEMINEIAKEKASIIKAESEIQAEESLLIDESKILVEVEKIKSVQEIEKANTRKLEEESHKYGVHTNSLEGSCPLDGKECNRIEEINECVQKNKDKYIEITKAISESRRKREELQQQIDGLVRKVHHVEQARERISFKKNSIYISNRNINMLEASIEDLKKLKLQFGDVEEKLESKKEEVNKQNEYKNKIYELKKQKEQQEEAMHDLNRQIGSIDGKVETLQEQLEEISEWKKKLKTYQKEKEILKFCFNMFSKDGIQASQLRARMDHIESEVNQILEEIDCGFNVKITTERELTTWQSVCLECGFDYPKGSSAKKCSNCNTARERNKKEELDIKILVDGKIRGFEQQSGGSQVLISLAIRLAIVKIRQQITGKSMGILALDEIFGMLDKVNRNEVYSLLLNYVGECLGFKQVFSISHLDDNVETDGFIVVTKGNKSSEVEFAETIILQGINEEKQ